MEGHYLHATGAALSSGACSFSMKTLANASRSVINMTPQNAALYRCESDNIRDYQCELYIVAPLFTGADRAFNLALARAFEAEGHDVPTEGESRAHNSYLSGEPRGAHESVGGRARLRRCRG
jgi:hypothetical protein